MVTRWTFYDPALAQTQQFEVNPKEGGTPDRKKTVTYQNTAAPDGKTLVFQGRDDPQSFEFSGILLSESEYDMFMTWFDKPRQIRVTDDLGRQFWIFITEFSATRKFSRNYPFRHDYKVSATVLDWS